MSSRTRWLLTFAVALLATPAWAQPQLGTANLGPPMNEIPIPLMWDQRDEGFYFVAEVVASRMNNPLKTQVVARRGFRDLNGTLRGTGGLLNIFDTATPPNYFTTLFTDRGPAGAAYGSNEIALTTADAARDNFQPGTRLNFGYRFRNGMAIDFSYMGITKARNNAFAGIVPPHFQGGQDDDSTFLYSDFFNFSPYFAGPTRDIISNVFVSTIPPGLEGGGNLGINPVPADLVAFGGFLLPAYGITNGAEFYSISHVMGFHTAELNLRVPVLQVEGTRTYWTGGFRYISHSERFRMRVEDLGFDNTPADPLNGGDEGNVSDPSWALRYTVKQKNKFYGLQSGVGGEAYLTNGFAVSLDTKFGVLGGTSRTTTVLQRLDLINGVGIKRTNNQFNMAGMFQGGAYLWWYAHEGVTFRVGYEYLGLVGARRLTEPLTYDWGELNVRARNTFLSLDSIVAGFSFVF